MSWPEHFQGVRNGAPVASKTAQEERPTIYEERIMDRMLVVVFNNEVQAYQGRQALLQLDSDGNISVYAYAVLAKHADGTASVKQGDDSGPIGTLLGTSFGSLIGLLGGPVGLAVGAGVGVLTGAAVDLNDARIGDDFIDDVTKKLTPNKFAVVAEIEEDWTAP